MLTAVRHPHGLCSSPIGKVPAPPTGVKLHEPQAHAQAHTDAHAATRAEAEKLAARAEAHGQAQAQAVEAAHRLKRVASMGVLIGLRSACCPAARQQCRLGCVPALLQW